MKILETPYGICHLSVVPVRVSPCESAEMCTQLLFGELLQVTEKHDNWCLIRLLYDNSEGWVATNQFTEISDKDYKKALKKKEKYAHKWLTKLRLKTGADLYLHIPKGATFSHNHLLHTSQSTQRAPHPSVVQIVFKLCGVHLPRTAQAQASCGSSISFLEESKAGDLAFFDDEEGNIIHVGILLGDNKIIHSYGKVRIDRLDHIGIFNNELRNYTHQLRLLRKIDI